MIFTVNSKAVHIGSSYGIIWKKWSVVQQLHTLQDIQLWTIKQILHFVKSADIFIGYFQLCLLIQMHKQNLDFVRNEAEGS